jgi:hypothetical protein
MRTAAAGGDEFLNDGITWIFVVNGANNVDITIEIFPLVDGQAVVDRVVQVLDGDNAMIGIFPTNWYNGEDGRVQLTYDDESNVTFALLRY